MKESIKINNDLGNAQSLWKDVLAIREKRPLIHNITNYVVMDFTANVLLALGASPVMAHAIDEVADMCSIADALVVNIGTLSEPWVESMYRAFVVANHKGIPTVFDPVGAGATQYRTRVTMDLIQKGKPKIIRGNASEIASIVKSTYSTRGVDSTLEASEVLEEAKILSNKNNNVVVISGAEDFVFQNKNQAKIYNGDAMMPLVTGMGCAATALIGAFSSVNTDLFRAASHAMAFIGIAGELAGKNNKGPGSFRTAFIDAIYGMEKVDIETHLKMEILK